MMANPHPTPSTAANRLRARFTWERMQPLIALHDAVRWAEECRDTHLPRLEDPHGQRLMTHLIGRLQDGYAQIQNAELDDVPVRSNPSFAIGAWAIRLICGLSFLSGGAVAAALEHVIHG